MKRKTCQHGRCDWVSLPGLINGVCRFHWTMVNWGMEWASQCHTEHPEAIRFSRDQQAKVKTS